MNEQPLDKRLVRAAFDRAAPGYDAAAVLQREVASRLLERLDLVRLKPQRILDVGSGTGACTAALARRYPKARLTALDLAPAMVRATRRRFNPLTRRWRGHGFVCGDAERLPFADASFDLIVSNLTLQWCADLERTFGGLRRALAPGGLLLFSSFGPDTLKELRAAWAAADTAVHVNRFIDMHDIGDAMLRARLADPVMDMEMLILTYTDVTALMRDLKAIGAHNVNPDRPHALTGKARLKAVADAYERFRTADRLPATYEVLYGHAWGPTAAELQRRGRSGGDEVRIGIDELRGRRA
jgi:malonyl-CoA O-methyltransferase